MSFEKGSVESTHKGTDQPLPHETHVMVLSQGVSPTETCAALTDVCSAALGYVRLLRKSPFMLTWATLMMT